METMENVEAQNCQDVFLIRFLEDLYTSTKNKKKESTI